MSTSVELGERPSQPQESIPASLQDALKEEARSNGHYESVIEDKSRAHKWNLGGEKIRPQQLYHSKYLYDDKEGVIQSDEQDSCCIRVHPIPKGFYELEMYDFFSQIAPIRRMRIWREPKNGVIVPKKSYALVDFKNPESASLICEEIPVLYVRGELVNIKHYKAPVPTREKFFNRFTPEEYAAQILKDSSQKGEDWSKKRRRVIPSLMFASQRSIPPLIAYIRNKRQQENEEKLNEKLKKYDLEYHYQDIDIEVPASSEEKKTKKTTKKSPSKAASHKSSSAAEGKKRKRSSSTSGDKKKKSKKSRKH